MRLIPRRAIERQPSSSNVPSKELWVGIWKQKTQPKVKHFLWRVCAGSLPTMDALHKRRCSTVDVCQRCRNGPETIEHMLLLCEPVKRLWFASPLALRISEEGVRTFE